MIHQRKNGAGASALPTWFHQEVPDAGRIRAMKSLLGAQALTTVCEHARCPNMGQCWGRGVATFMILGSVCTRQCRFCAVEGGSPGAVDPREPVRVAQTVCELGLKYVVITSVTRDDLPDAGVGQFIQTMMEIRMRRPDIKIELLIPDCSGRSDLVRAIVAARPDVLGHNIDMVTRLFSTVRPRADYLRSLNVLRMMNDFDPTLLVKSGFMVGLGETDEEIEDLMKDLKAVGCDMLTIGQYLAPTKGTRHVPVRRFVAPQVFERYQAQALALGFRHVFSGPLVRSSYLAESSYQSCVVQDGGRT